MPSRRGAALGKLSSSFRLSPRFFEPVGDVVTSDVNPRGKRLRFGPGPSMATPIERGVRDLLGQRGRRRCGDGA